MKLISDCQPSYYSVSPYFICKGKIVFAKKDFIKIKQSHG